MTVGPFCAFHDDACSTTCLKVKRPERILCKEFLDGLIAQVATGFKTVGDLVLAKSVAMGKVRGSDEEVVVDGAGEDYSFGSSESIFVPLEARNP